MLGRVAFRSSRILSAPFKTSAPLRAAVGTPSKAARNKDAELYPILLGLTGATILVATYYSKKTDLRSATSKLETRITETTNNTASSALCEVIVPSVNLPEELHEQFNKYGKPQSEW